jgi:hypothetical protein
MLCCPKTKSIVYKIYTNLEKDLMNFKAESIPIQENTAVIEDTAIG